MSVESELHRFQGLQATLGKRAVNALFPNDFEIYIFALEIVNGNDETEDYFIFPVTPSSINESKNPVQSIKKTAGGITVLNTSTFSPSDITMQGNFGRKFKFLTGGEIINFSSINFKPSLGQGVSSFNKNIKTGYGCVKLMESIINKSNTIDKQTGLPYGLFFHNLALGNSYLVKALNFNFYQNLETNLIWNYNLQLKSLARVEDITDKNQRSLTVALSANSAIQDRVNNFGNNVGSLISDIPIPSNINNLDSNVGNIAKNLL